MASRTKKVQTEEAPVRKRVTTAIVLKPHTLAVYQRVAALRGATGRTEQTEAGIERPYSVSALIREKLEAAMVELEAELTASGIEIPEDGE